MESKIQTQTKPDSDKQLKDKLLLTLEMFDLGVSIKEQNLHRENPGLSEKEIKIKLRKWLQTRPGAELGDCPGKPVSLESFREA